MDVHGVTPGLRSRPVITRANRVPRRRGGTRVAREKAVGRPEVRRRMMAHRTSDHSPIQVQKYLKGIDYPASKDDLVNKAQANGAPEEVMRVLQQLPGDRFDGPDN